MTYDEAQVAKPLKVCQRCQRPWYMVADVCAECLDGLSALSVRRSVQESPVFSINEQRFDVNGVEITGP